MSTKQTDLSDILRKLEKIVLWFESQESVDVEEGLKKVKEGALLIQGSRERLQQAENEFLEIKKSLEEEKTS